MSAITFYSLSFVPFIPKIISPFSLTIHQSSLGFSNLAIVFQHRSISDDNFAFHGPTKRRKNISPTRFDCFSPPVEPREAKNIAFLREAMVSVARELKRKLVIPLYHGFESGQTLLKRVE